ncbi:capsular biosynthesis protein [Proteiniclasticum sp. SCR006]|uniref:Capsular biosynthesis protein n=1 Tax=Proteiniclasticum aestuarii TaxID=2817862 RepID=A0A939H3E6_9CLOT|nr:capsular biosynthesis protein [Proteiniclasticum aestuarii]MBO1263447.1 capsular biosynthesis protein [Proteiniclasticum aestuarii]
MDYINHLKSNLSGLIFLEINKTILVEHFQIPEIREREEELFLPLSPEYIAENINEDLTKNLPFGEFVKGMYYVAGADPSFNQMDLYKAILNRLSRASVIKGLVTKLIQEEKLEEALIYLLGLYHVHGEKEVLKNALVLLEELSLKISMYREALLKYADEAIALDIIEGYLFKGSALRFKEDFVGALHNIREYLRLGGEETSEITEEIEFLDRKSRILEGEEILYDNPQRFLELVLPLLSREEDNPRLLLMIAIAYRILKNHEKAIFYLNDALAVDEAYVDVLNELGINYAAIGDYAQAVNYFRTLFEQVRTIEILTNLIMCYINLGDLNAAKDHIAIGELMDGEDEILLEIKAYMDKLEKKKE